jgi:hypothetical protein
MADQEKSTNQWRKPERQPEPEEFKVAIHRNKNSGATAPEQDQQQPNAHKKNWHCPYAALPLEMAMRLCAAASR